MTPEQTLAAFWARTASASPRVHAVVALAGAHHPVGYVIGWGVLRSYAEMVLGRQSDPDKWHIVEMEPPT